MKIKKEFSNQKLTHEEFFSIYGIDLNLVTKIEGFKNRNGVNLEFSKDIQVNGTEYSIYLEVNVENGVVRPSFTFKDESLGYMLSGTGFRDTNFIFTEIFKMINELKQAMPLKGVEIQATHERARLSDLEKISTLLSSEPGFFDGYVAEYDEPDYRMTCRVEGGILHIVKMGHLTHADDSIETFSFAVVSV